jgi:predicted Zn-dependent protease
VKTALAVVPLALTVQATARRTQHDMTQLPVEALECSRFLRSMARRGDRVICRKPHIAFHAGVEAVPFPFADRLAELASAARAQKARWLFFSWPEAEMRPGFWYLLDTTATVPGLIVRHATAPRPAVLYEIGPEFGREPAWLANDTLRTLHVARAKLRVDPSDARALATLGGIAFDRGDYPAAREQLQRAAQRAPGRYEVWMMLGETSLFLDDAQGAETAYQQALRLRPDIPEPRIGLGWASMVGRRAQEAAVRWRPVISATRDPHTLERMVELFHALGDRQAESEARAMLARAGAAR